MQLYQQDDHYTLNFSTEECSLVSRQEIDVLLHRSDLEDLKQLITELLETT